MKGAARRWSSSFPEHGEFLTALGAKIDTYFPHLEVPSEIGRQGLTATYSKQTPKNDNTSGPKYLAQVYLIIRQKSTMFGLAAQSH